MTNAERDDSRVALFFEGQWLHALALIVLLAGCYWAVQLPEARQGALWGWRSIDWFWIATLTAVAHQAYVWLCWRAELYQ